MSQQGIYGSSHNRYMEYNEQSTIHKMKETYWTTKQTVMKKLGKKEDEHVVSSDAELDAKLEVFQSIQKSSMNLLRCIEKYQDSLCALSQEENAMGRFLKTNSQTNKTRAGKMMAAVGKAQSFSSQHRLSLRVPLVRLYQEVETFRYRAITDTLLTINRMETARTEYRGALMWMKDASDELDPDTFKALEKFRKVQAQVKKTKAKFDKLKLDTMQKIDLLAASRCNMYSHVLANYQTTLLHFWEKTSRTMSAVADSFKGYQYFEFNMLKELAEPSKRLAEATGSTDTARDVSNDNGLISLGEEQADGDGCHGNKGSLTNLLEAVDKELEKTAKPVKKSDGSGNFIDFEEEDFEPECDLEELKRRQDAEFDLTRLPSQKNPKGAPSDLLTDDFTADDSHKDDLTLLNEILNAPSTGGDDFSREWQAVFGATPHTSTANSVPGDVSQSQKSDFMPSFLLDTDSQMSGASATGQATPATGQATPAPATNKPTSQQTPAPKPKPKQQQSDMSNWFNLFADLDPLSNPDAVGKTREQMNDAL